MKMPSLILDSIRVDINDLKADARSLMPKDKLGYFMDDGSVFWNLCRAAAKRFMAIVAEFDKLGFSQQELDELIKNFFTNMVVELIAFEDEFCDDYVELSDVTHVLLDCFNEFAKSGWKVDFSSEKVLYKKKEA